MSKPQNPYTSLLQEFREFARGVAHRRTLTMWRYPKEALHKEWKLTDLYERVAAAEQLGFDVQLTSDDLGLTVCYVKKVPSVPWVAR